MTLLLIVGFSLVGGLVSVLLAGTVLGVRPSAMEKALPRLVSFSTGTLLGAAFLGMLPHAVESYPISTVSIFFLTGIVTFFVMEKLLVWRHCHKHNCEIHAGSGPLLLVGDAFHNLVDGVVIAGAFLSSPLLGITVSLSTIAHEVPQEIGEYVVYIHSGYTRRRALLLNSATSLTSVIGGVLGYFFLLEIQEVRPFLMAFAAAGFTYVALADLIPAQRGKISFASSIFDLILMVAGIGVIALLQHDH